MRKIFTAFMMMLCAVCMASAANYLTFTAEEDSSSFGIVNENNTPDVQYSLDDGATWTALVGGTEVTLVSKGDKALLKGNNSEGFSKDWTQYSSFTMTGKVAASGSVMSLIDGVGLSTEIPNNYCFQKLFSGCTSLTQAPELPVTTLNTYCYYGMFSDCTSLTKAPELPATTLARYCYSGMFSGCTSLTQAPELPASSLEDGCYYKMFEGCTSLTQASVLPATTLAYSCYSSMFSGCTSLAQAPELPATTLAKNCYTHMFTGCTNLSEIRVAFVTWEDFDVWVENVSYTGTFICPEELPLECGKNRIPLGWEVKNIIDGDTVNVPINRDYLTFTAEEDGSSFEMKNFNKNDPEVHYSLDGGETWTRLLQGDTILLAHKGDKALLRGGNPQGFSKGEYDFSTFKMTGKVAASGNVMSLIDGSGSSTEIPCSYCFRKLFSGCTSLTQAPELPATTLASYCYWGMFLGCTSLTQSPALPATTLAEKCYYEMFSGCTGLTQAQDLSATSMAGYSCQRMFYNCTSLTQAPALQATKLGKYSCQNMFSNCTSLTQAPALPATTLSTYCYDGMFSGCTSLTQAPALPATSLESSCYYKMFEGCTSLTQAPALPATRMCVYCYQSMFSGCTSLTQAPALPATSLESSCYYKMFEGCTSLTQAPVLPATRIVYDSYENMFRGCTNLSEIKVSFTDWIDGSTYEWVRNVAPAGTFICSKALPLTYGVSRIPEGWTVIYVEDINYLTFTAEEDSSSFGIVNMNNNPDVQYSLDGGATWIALAEGDTVVLAHVGDKALLRGVNPQGFSKKDSYSSFRMSGKMAASGSVMSLIDGLGLSTEIPGEFCFRNLFSDCTSLTQAPELPVTALAEGCYAYMFSGCTSLTRAPELPAMTLAEACYFGMFEGCTSLTRAPALLATTLPTVSNVKSGCYGLMFSGCTSLSRIRVSFDDWNEGLHTEVWVKDVAPTGTFICPKALALEYGMDRIPDGWTVKYIEDEPNYLTFTAEEDSSSFGIVNIVESYPEVTCSPDIWYSTDGGDSWNELKQGDTIPLKKGKKALLKGVNPKGVSIGRSEDILDGITYVSFVMSGKIAASGNVMSLVDGEGKTTQIPANYCFYGLFSGCKSLTQAPVLPATMLTEYCYGEMFAGCTGLTEAPELPATDMKRGCYASMFSGCNLTQAPKLPALNLAPSCYGYMFSRNKMLTQAPELPATELADSCYDGMFLRCEKLVQAPILLATKLKPHCYSSMFEGCISLTQAPELIATELAPFCYCRMFHSCTGLTEAPELPDTKELVSDSYRFMFSYCSNLNTIKVHFKAWVEDNYSGYCWVNDVSPTGTFYCPRELPIEYGIARIPKGWNVVYIDDTVAVEANYLTFTAEEDGSSFGIVNNGDNNPDLQYSLDGGKTWTALAVGDTVILAHKGDKALLKGNNSEGFSKDWTQYSSFTMTGKVAASGSVMSLIDGVGLSTEIPNNYCFQKLFSGCTSLTQAPELPATTLAYSCYSSMFSGCTSLTKAPELPATTLTGNCYGSMFSGCTSLTQAPELPATTLAYGCYRSMFSGCTSLTQAPELPATTLAISCYEYMFYGCTSLTKAPELPATTLVVTCYLSMFSDCVSLTSADLSFEQYVGERSCCNDMFRGCTNLSEIKVSFEEWGDGDLENPSWVKNVAPTGTFICPKDLPLEYGDSRIPEGWTVKYIDDTVAVEANYLTFTAEEDGSSFGIVNNGSNNPDVQYSLDGGATWIALAEGDTVILAHKGDKALLKGNNPEGFSKSWEQYSTFKMTGKVAASGSVMSLIDGVGLSTEISKSFCFYRLFSGCTSLTQAPELPAKTLAYYCYNSMFEGCTSLTQAPELPATEMTFYCYNRMFSGCTSLTQAPELPATTLFENCYSGMFSGCTSLTRAPELPAIKMFSYCYSGMFSGCTSLTQAPELPAKEFLGKYSYSGMFSGCTSLSEINVSFDDWDKFDATFEWVADVAPTGTFICPKTLALEYGISRIPEGWTVKYIEDMANYLTFTAEEDGSSFGIVNNGSDNPDVQYSLDGGETWNILAEGDSVILVHKGDKALLRGDNPEGFSKSWEQYSTFKMTGKVAASGSVMSLIDGVGIPTKIPSDFCFYELFYNCTSLTQAPELPATTLAYSCYRDMFEGCTSLTQAPKLPATTLAEACYFGMFSSCTSLTQAPELPATTLPTTSNVENGCYSLMFLGCTSLTQAPELPATTLAEGCYTGMFYACTSLTQAPKLPATTLADFCYFEMFSGCTSLTQAPELPAKEFLGKYSYSGMFSGCTSLSKINVSFATWSDYYSNTDGWVKDVAPTGTFICPKALALEYGVSRIPEGWTVKYAEEGSGVSSALADDITVWTDDLTIFVRGAEGEVSLYDMSGKRVAVSNSKAEERALSVPFKGVYVVRTSGGERSVLVR